MAKNKLVYYFGDGKADGTAKMKNLLGGKGANLAEMCRLGIPVPAGFTITTEVCGFFDKKNAKVPAELKKQVEANLKKAEKAMGAKFGDTKNPLLVSVRSGARVSMPGMMDTILNLGLNDKTVKGLITQSGDARFAYDSYRRFVQMYGDVVMGMPSDAHGHDRFELMLDALKKKRKARTDVDLSGDDLKGLVAQFKQAIKKHTGKAFPEDPMQQLWGAVHAVFDSWYNKRAYEYRRMNDIPHDWGTAVNVCSMVYGNMGEDSGTGVAFTRNPATGEKGLFGEYLINAQGEDVVAGTRTPEPISKLAEVMPKIYKEYDRLSTKLEKHYRDMQDMEFTIQRGKLWMLQTRTGKRTGFAAVNIAVDMVNEKLIKPEEALLRLEADQLNQVLQPIFDDKAKSAALREGRLLAKGLNAGPGAACGHIAFTPEKAVEYAAKGQTSLLVRIETSPEDISGMKASAGILTARGGATSHAALVARQMGKVCVAGCGDLQIDYKKKTMKAAGKTLKEGDFLSLDGTTGEVIQGKVETKASEVIQALVPNTDLPAAARKKLMQKAAKGHVYKNFQQILGWADKYRRLRVRTNADQPDQSAVAVAFGAEGIGLTRTEHMFFGEGTNNDKITAVRQMILADDEKGRRAALKKLLPMQRKDFEGIFTAMNGKPVTIRTLDPPLHEFLPHDKKAIAQLAKSMKKTPAQVAAKIESLAESNPMLGHRGCRLGIVYPEITEMQAQAIIEAAINISKKGVKVMPEIMIPLVTREAELANQAEVVRQVCDETLKKAKSKVKYMVGTMIEIPRAALTADEIANQAEFFSFGTNDLTQTGMGISRDDSAGFLGYYAEKGIMEKNPFESLDTTGIGRLMEIAVEGGRKTRPDIKLGICGEHGGDPSSIEFCHKLGLAYVSCSPFRVPVARLAAAIAELKYPSKAAKKAKARPKKKAGKKKK